MADATDQSNLTAQSGAIFPKTESRKLLFCVLLFVLVLLVYFPVVHNDFITLDDDDYVVKNLHVQQGVNAPLVAWAFTSTHANNWHPLTWISHAFDFKMFGLNAAGHHLVNVLWHAANTALLFLVLRRMTGMPGRSLFVAALFGLHPAHVESVAWIAERKDVLSAFFWMLALWFYAGYVEAAKSGNPRRKPFYALTLISFTLGLLSKPMIVTLPFVLLLLDFWPLKRLRLFHADADAAEISWKKLLLSRWQPW